MRVLNSGFILLLRWQFLGIKPLIPLYVIAQVLLAVGIIMGFPFLIPNITDEVTIYLTTGAPTIILLSVGLVILPQGVAETKSNGTLDFMLSWPLPRLYYVLAESIIWLLMTLPGVFIALFIASIRFDITLSITYTTFPVLILTGLTAIGIGYAFTLWLKPLVAELLSQILIFAILLFSPINFPPERLPSWLATVHEFLPIQYMADLVRASLAPDYFDQNWYVFLVLGTWFILSFTLCYLAITKRD